MKTILKTPLFFVLLIIAFACSNTASNSQSQTKDGAVRKIKLTPPEGKDIAAFASGCFWCVEEVFEAVAGVDSAVSGYAGGTTPNPTYQTVSSGATNYAESVLVYYDPEVVSYGELLNVFYASHDPTTLNRQGPDAGPQYRSVIFYLNEQEKEQAKEAKKSADNSKKFTKPVVTQIRPLKEFYRAEEYHQDYIHHNQNNPYVRNVSLPRFEQFKKTYQGKLKPLAANNVK